MGKIAIYHPIFGNGGGEAVCMNVIEALQGSHDLTLYTISDIDRRELNEYFNTNVNHIAVENTGFVTKGLNLSYEFLNSMSESGLGRLHASIFGQQLRPKLTDYDLVISTFGEFRFEAPSVQYVHYPLYNKSSIPDVIESRGSIRRIYDGVCEIASGNWRKSIDPEIMLANSEWTANLNERVHGVPTRTIYPPVDTAGFQPKPWEQRKNGFVAIGRMDPSKRIEDLIEIAEQLQERGHDYPLHIIGPKHDKRYYKKMQERASQNNRIFLEGKVSREKLIELICSYKYALHGMHHEHFGIVVAEFVAGGAIPFIHDSGGQKEIVGDEKQLRYASIQDAVDKIDSVLTSPSEQMRLKENLPNIEEQFGKKRFQRQINNVVEDLIERC